MKSSNDMWNRLSGVISLRTTFSDVRISNMEVSEVSVLDVKPSKYEILRELVSEKLTSAAREILTVVERTVSGYEEEAAGLRREIEQQRSQLEALLQPRVFLSRIDEEDSIRWTGLSYAEEVDAEDEVVEESNSRAIVLRVCLLEDVHTNYISRHVLKSRVQAVKCPLGLTEAEFLDLLRSTFPQLSEEFESYGVDTTRRLTPLKLRELTPEKIKRVLKSIGKGRSALYIKEKGTNDSETGFGTRLNLRVCLLKDFGTNVGRRGMKSQMEEVMCPRRLKEAEFLDLLRSRFPQLTGGFDAFTADAKKKLSPLNVERMTPEIIHRAIKSRGKGRSALYLRVKEVRESQSSLEEETLLDIKEEPMEDTTRDEQGSHASSSCSPVERAESRQQKNELKEEVELEGISEDSSALDSVVCAADSNNRDDGEDEEEDEKDDGDEEWGPDGNKEEFQGMEFKVNPLKRKERTNSDVRTTREKHIQSSLKVSTENSAVPLSCKVCKAPSGTNNLLIKHSWSHVEDPERLCGVCGEHSESLEEMRSHLNSHKKTYSCEVCGKNLMSHDSLKVHAYIHTGEKPYRCDVCDKAYASRARLRIHRWEHAEEKPHKCDVCSQSFVFKLQLRVHSRSHTEGNLVCDVCGKGFSSVGALRRHQISHTRERPYECTVCGRTFQLSKGLRSHLKLHSSVKPFVCHVCGKACSRKDYLKVHMRTHNGEKPYECTVCGKSFTQSVNLKTHVKNHHSKEGTEEEELKE